MIMQVANRALCVALFVAATTAGGCATTTEPTAAALEPSGFLSTYRHLEPASPSSLRYTDPNNRLARYSKFIVAPVEVRLQEKSDVTPDEVRTIQAYMRDAIVDALSPRYQIVSTPSFDTAEIRVAVTNVRKSTPILNAVPRPKVLDLGLGGLTMEGEILDAESHVQVAAIMESRIGHNRSIDFTQLDDTMVVMDEWAAHFAGLIDEAHEFTIAAR